MRGAAFNVQNAEGKLILDETNHKKSKAAGLAALPPETPMEDDCDAKEVDSSDDDEADEAPAPGVSVSAADVKLRTSPPPGRPA